MLNANYNLQMQVNNIVRPGPYEAAVREKEAAREDIQVGLL